jgi:hypothetical protein
MLTKQLEALTVICSVTTKYKKTAVSAFHPPCFSLVFLNGCDETNAARTREATAFKIQ